MSAAPGVAPLSQPWPVYGPSIVNGIICAVLPVFLATTGIERVGPAVASQAGIFILTTKKA